MARTNRATIETNIVVTGASQSAGELKKTADSARKASVGLNQASRAARAARTSFGGAANASRNAGVAVTDFSRVVSDAPFGMVAVRNNLEQLVLSFGRTAASAGGAVGGLKAFIGAFTGVGGLLAVFTIGLVIIERFGPAIRKAFSSEAQNDLRTYNKEMKSLSDTFAEIDRKAANIRQHGRILTDAEQMKQEGIELLQNNEAYLRQLDILERISALKGAGLTEQSAEVIALRKQIESLNEELEDLYANIAQADSAIASQGVLDRHGAASKARPKREARGNIFAGATSLSDFGVDADPFGKKAAMEARVQGVEPLDVALAGVQARLAEVDVGSTQTYAKMRANAQWEQDWINRLNEDHKVQLRMIKEKGIVEAASAIISGKNYKKIAAGLALEAGKVILLTQLYKRLNAAKLAGTAASGGIFGIGAGIFSAISTRLGFASGGTIPGGPTLVGERGPEIIHGSRGQFIQSNRSLAQNGFGGGGDIVIQIDNREIARAEHRNLVASQKTGTGVF